MSEIFFRDEEKTWNDRVVLLMTMAENARDNELEDHGSFKKSNSYKGTVTLNQKEIVEITVTHNEERVIREFSIHSAK